MAPRQEGDVEAVEYDEQDSLLPTSHNQASPKLQDHDTRFRTLSLTTAAFLAGLLTCFLAQYSICGFNCFSSSRAEGASTDAHLIAPPYVGSSEVHNFPPHSPTNAYPSLFPTNVGHAGSTPTGAEPALIATAPHYPLHTGAAQLVIPDTLGRKEHDNRTGFNLLKHWGNLSPWYSVGKTTFGLDSEPGSPDGCRVTGLHFLHRHGARYPTGWGRSCLSIHFCALTSTVFKLPTGARLPLLPDLTPRQASGAQLVN